MAEDHQYLLEPGVADDLADLTIALCAHHFRDARLGLAATHAALAAASAPIRSAFLVQAHQALCTCREIARDLEMAYLISYRYQQQQKEQQLRQAAFLSDFRRRLVHVGTDCTPRVWSHLGWIEDNPDWPVAFSRDSGHVVLGAGVQGCGKTILSTLLGEGCLGGEEPMVSTEQIRSIYAFFHIEEHDRLPQLLDGLKPNPTPRDLEILKTRLGLGGLGLARLRMAVPRWLLPELMPRLEPFQDLGLEVVPLGVQLGQLGQPALEAALGAEDGARYVQRMLEDAQQQGKDLEISRMRHFIDTAEDLNMALKRAAHARLSGLAQIASPPGGPGMWELYEPGVGTVTYLGGPHMGRAHVGQIVVGLLGGLMMPSAKHGPCQRVITADEINLLAGDVAVWQALIRIGRLVRHRGSTLILLGQDLMCVPDELFGLAGICAVFQLRNPRVWEYIRDRVGALRGWRFEDVAGLDVAEALLAVTLSTDPGWQQGARRVKFRPPRCEHGGRTRAMI